MGFFFTFLSMATHLQLSITNVGRRMLLYKWNQMDIRLHHIANGAVFQASPVMRKGKQVIG